MFNTLLAGTLVIAVTYIIYRQQNPADMSSRKNVAPEPRQSKAPPYTVEVPGCKKVKGETIPRRNVASRDKLKNTPEDGINTVYDIVRRGARKFGNAKAVGYRKLLKTHNETKKIKKIIDGVEQEVDKNWTYFEMSEYRYMSFIEYERSALQAGAGLRKLGMERGDRLHLFAATRYV